MHTTIDKLTWKRWTDVNGLIGEMAHDPSLTRTYFRLSDPEGTIGAFAWSKFGEAGMADGHARAIAWGQVSPRLPDPTAALGYLAAFGGTPVCYHLHTYLISECPDCAEDKLEELTAEALAEYEVIRLDIGVNATNARAVNPVDDELGEKLSQLCAEYDSAKAAADAAAERLSELKAGIKATAQLLRPGAKAVRIVSDDLEHDLTVTKGLRNSLDSRLIRKLCDQAGVDYKSLTKATETVTLKAVK